MAQPADWYADPSGRYQYRYWDGTQWTDQVSSGGPSAIDPNPLSATIVNTPPAPGSNAAPIPEPVPPQPAVQVTQSSGGNTMGMIIGVIIALIAVIVLVVILMSGSDGDTTETTTVPDTTEEPAPTEAPEEPAPTEAPEE